MKFSKQLLKVNLGQAEKAKSQTSLAQKKEIANFRPKELTLMKLHTLIERSIEGDLSYKLGKPIEPTSKMPS